MININKLESFRLPCPSWKRKTYFLAQVVNMASPGAPVAMKIMSVELGNTDREKIKEKLPMLNSVEKIHLKHATSMFCV